MKLVTKTILYYILICIPLLIIATILSFKLISGAVNENVNETLLSGKIKAQQIIDSHAEPVSLFLDYDSLSRITIDTTNGQGSTLHEIFKMDYAEREEIKFRELKSYYNKKGTNYLITITKPMLEEDDLIENLFTSLLIIIGFLVMAFFIVNWFISKTLWNPFYKIIKQVNAYEIKNKPGISFTKTSTKEFKQLSIALNKMTEKIYEDFIAQKEFSENASHEMQTPLAVIKAKLDLLIQSPNLKEKEMEQLQGIENSVNKLSYLNRAMLLLAKIENSQFIKTEEVNLSQLIEKVVVNYEDLIASKNISFKKNIIANYIINMNPVLCDVLITNLLQNALRHNHNNGEINIELTRNKFIISNSGKRLTINENELFGRFKKNDASNESIGLGLSIVKSITDTYGFSVEYKFENDLHTFIINF